MISSFYRKERNLKPGRSVPSILGAILLKLKVKVKK